MLLSQVFSLVGKRVPEVYPPAGRSSNEPNIPTLGPLLSLAGLKRAPDPKLLGPCSPVKAVVDAVVFESCNTRSKGLITGPSEVPGADVKPAVSNSPLPVATTLLPSC